ncbi:Transcription elongation factor 1-like protein, partial [Lachnellula willkommii]
VRVRLQEPFTYSATQAKPARASFKLLQSTASQLLHLYKLTMGKRKKAAKKPTGKKNEPLAKSFPCLFCNHENSVSVEIDKKGGVGNLSCKVCSQQFQCAINYLSAAVDVYSEWVDACDTVAKDDGEEGGGSFAPARAPVAGRPTVGNTRDEDDDDEHDDIIDDEDGLGGYGGHGVVADDEY